MACSWWLSPTEGSSRIQHAEFQPEKVVWLEGIRVHPDFRGQGIARDLLQRALEIAAERGNKVARLSTSTENSASMSVVRRNGFHEIAHFHGFFASALQPETGSSGLEPAGNEHLAATRKLMEQTSTLLVTSGWTAKNVPDQMAVTDFAIAVWLPDDGANIILASPRPERKVLGLAYVGGSQQAIERLGHEMRLEAFRRGLEGVNGMLDRSRALDAGLAAAGYELRTKHSMLLFERSISKGRSPSG